VGSLATESVGSLVAGSDSDGTLIAVQGQFEVGSGTSPGAHGKITSQNIFGIVGVGVDSSVELAVGSLDASVVVSVGSLEPSVEVSVGSLEPSVELGVESLDVSFKVLVEFLAGIGHGHLAANDFGSLTPLAGHGNRLHGRCGGMGVGLPFNVGLPVAIVASETVLGASVPVMGSVGMREGLIPRGAAEVCSSEMNAATRNARRRIVECIILYRECR